MNNFCQLCGYYIMLLGMMSLGSVDKVSKHYCHCSMRKQLVMMYDSTWLGASENDYRVPTSAKIPLLVVGQTLFDIRHYYLGNL